MRKVRSRGVFLVLVRSSLIFVLLTVGATHESSSRWDDAPRFDKAPAELLAAGHKTPDSAQSERAVLQAVSLPSRTSWPPLARLRAEPRRRCRKAPAFRRTWFLRRRRVPRLRDDADDP
jgi:hypothetical protein